MEIAARGEGREGLVPDAGVAIWGAASKPETATAESISLRLQTQACVGPWSTGRLSREHWWKNDSLTD